MNVTFSDLKTCYIQKEKDASSFETEKEGSGEIT